MERFLYTLSIMMMTQFFVLSSHEPGVLSSTDESIIFQDSKQSSSIGYDYKNPLRGSLGAIVIAPSVFDRLDKEEFYFTENHEVRSLFKVNQELESLQEIAFEDSKKSKLTQEDLTLLVDELVAADTKKASVPGESFDYKELKESDEDDEDDAIPKDKQSEIQFSFKNSTRNTDDIAYVVDPILEHSQLPAKIDSNLVSNTDYALFLKETKHSVPSHWQNGAIPFLEENKPVVNISYQDALDYAAWKGKRLPTQEELLMGYRNGDISTYGELGLFEWSSTSPDQPGPAQMHQIAVEISEDGQPYQTKMLWHESNHQTGFRCVLD